MAPKKCTLKLSANDLAALNHWVGNIISISPPWNYHTMLMVMILARLWEKKIYPKTARISPANSIKLDEAEALALNMTFMIYDLMDAPDHWQANLHFIRSRLPRIRDDEPLRFDPPKIATTP